MPRDWESWLRTAAQPASRTEEQERDRTFNRVRDALGASREIPSSVRIYTKGSYATNANVRRDADVDIAVEWTATAYVNTWGETAGLGPDELGAAAPRARAARRSPARGPAGRRGTSGCRCRRRRCPRRRSRTGAPPSDVTQSTRKSAPCSCASRAISGSGCQAPVEVSACTSATSFGRRRSRAPPRPARARTTWPHGASTRIDGRAGALGDVGHARAEDAVHADDHLVARLEQVHEARFHAGAAGARDREGERVLGREDERGGAPSPPPSSRRRPDRDGRRAAPTCARSTRGCTSRRPRARAAGARAERTRRGSGHGARLYTSRGRHATNQDARCCRPRSSRASARVVGADGVLDRPEALLRLRVRRLHARENRARASSSFRARPSEVVGGRAAARRGSGVPFVPRGAGTGLAGGTLPVGGGS